MISEALYACLFEDADFGTEEHAEFTINYEHGLDVGNGLVLYVMIVDNADRMRGRTGSALMRIGRMNDQILVSTQVGRARPLHQCPDVQCFNISDPQSLDFVQEILEDTLEDRTTYKIGRPLMQSIWGNGPDGTYIKGKKGDGEWCDLD